MSLPQELLAEPALARDQCPFCAQSGFKRLGNHLPRCKERNGRDYSIYLSEKTKSKVKAAGYKSCPNCHKRFRRLDTHLRNSATCKVLPSLPPSLPIDSVDTETDQLQGNTTVTEPSAILNFTPLDFSCRPKLKLPSTQEEWDAANLHFANVLVPRVLSETSPSSKNTALCNGIYHHFASKYGTKAQSKRHSRQLKQAQLLNNAKKAKNEARRNLRKARTDGTLSPQDILDLARRFFQLVRTHNSCSRAYNRTLTSRRARHARHECHHNFWPFAKHLLDDSSQQDIEPQFSEEDAIRHFTETYSTQAKSFSLQNWMSPPPNTPTKAFNCEGITAQEIIAAISKSKAKSAPCPFDGVPYRVFKNCPALVVALQDLYNLCWVQSTIPAEWKTASMRLIGKQTAKDDPTLPTNFRPIALTSCVGKLFTSILCNRWLSFMLSNNYLDRSIQKAFMPKTPGCIEHHLKLATVLNDARQKHKSLAVCWIDLANAYGSVHHSLISYALQHYHAPP